SSSDYMSSISIQDNGPGIQDELLDKIFDTFFTTKEVGEGTGLGLSISKKIIEAHQGEIKYISQKQGARFEIKLPALETLSYIQNDKYLVGMTSEESIKVLIIDNEVQVL